MNSPFRLSSRAWMIIPSCAIGFLIWINCDRVQRVEYVSNLADWSVDTPAVDPTSPTGYADGTRRLLVPDHNHDSYQWIATTQQMLASGQWRVRHVGYYNAPFRRDVHSAPPPPGLVAPPGSGEHAV